MPLISPNFLVWKFRGNAQFPHSFGQITRNCAFQQNFHTRKLGEITIFPAVGQMLKCRFMLLQKNPRYLKIMAWTKNRLKLEENFIRLRTTCKYINKAARKFLVSIFVLQYTNYILTNYVCFSTLQWLPLKLMVKIYNRGLMENYAKWLSRCKSNYWNYFNKIIKLTGFN